MRYEEAAREIWRHRDLHQASSLQSRLVEYATLAASSHNTQPWLFELEPDCISILPDLSRRCPQVDPDDHHLYASLGCAAENLVLAAVAAGLHGTVRYDADHSPSGAVQIHLAKGPASPSPLFDAIPERRCTRAQYDGSQLSNEDLDRLKGAGSAGGVTTLMLTDRKRPPNRSLWGDLACHA